MAKTYTSEELHKCDKETLSIESNVENVTIIWHVDTVIYSFNS